jgi:TRAP-type C4-dicarboxylate transport system substrate-binding protein
LEVAKFQRKINRDAEEKSMKDMASKGVTVIRDVDRDSFRKAMAPVFDQFSSQFPKAEIETILNAK